MSANHRNEAERMLGTPDVAKRLGVTTHTVARWIRKGLLPAVKMGELGRYKIREADLERALDKMGYDDETAEDDEEAEVMAVAHK